MRRVLALALAACNSGRLAAPRPEAMEPASADEGAPQPVTIRGSFHRDVEADFQSQGVAAGAGFAASLNSVALNDVRFVDRHTLTATVPPLSAGDYALTVTDPAGRSGSLDHAFTVLAVGDCVDATDCADPCFPEATCNGTTCVMGPGKDEDGDLAVDMACPGGSDCADTPGTDPNCGGLDGALCHPGHAETCDGADNDCDGLTDNDPSCQAVNTPPVAVARVTPGAGVPTSTLFTGDATGSYDREQAASSLLYQWDWDGDGSFDATGESPTHTFSAPGFYTVILAVDDDDGLRGYAVFTVTVSDPAQLYTVSTEVDENDPGATPAAPLGNGLSLREAIAIANATAGQQTILVPTGYVILASNTMTPPTGADGIVLVADGSVLDGSLLMGQADCFNFGGSNSRFYGLEIRNCPDWAIVLFGGDGNHFARLKVHDNGRGIYSQGTNTMFGPGNEVARTTGYGLQVAAAGARVEDNRFTDNLAAAIYAAGPGAGLVVVGNLFLANDSAVFLGNQADNVRVLFNTIHGHAGHGLFSALTVAGLDVRNNTFTSNTSGGMFADAANFAANDYNNFYNNTPCSNCTPGAQSLGNDPLYVDVTGRDFRLLPASSLIDAGTSLGFDRNGPASGDDNRGPDIGAFEAP